MRSASRPLFKAWTAFSTAHCYVAVERFDSALSVLLQYTKSTDSNSVHDSCTVSVLVLMYTIPILGLTCSNFNPSFNSPHRSFLRNKLGLYRDAIGAAYEAISILRLFPADSIFNGFFWWGEDRNPHDAIGAFPFFNCAANNCLL